MFPAETVPDGAAWAPHHLTWGVAFALLACLVVWDNYRDVEPIYSAAALAVTAFAFLFVWPFYAEAGAALTLVGLTVAIGALLTPSLPWTHYPTAPHAVCLALTLVAVDDALSHAFGVWTPIDHVWSVAVYPLLA